jgi:hypothetical protein
VNERLARLVEPFDVVEGRLTGLLGLLWFTGGAVPLLALALGAYDDSWLPGVIGVTVLAVVLGGALLLARSRVLSRNQYALLTILGGAAIAFHTASAGPASAGWSRPCSSTSACSPSSASARWRGGSWGAWRRCTRSRCG